MGSGFGHRHFPIRPGRAGTFSPGKSLPVCILPDIGDFPERGVTPFDMDRCASEIFAPYSGAFLAPDHSAVDKTTLANAMRAHASQVDRSGKLVLRTARKLRLPRTFGQMGPSQRIKM